MKRNTIPGPAFATLALAGASAQADDGPTFTVSGFGTYALTRADTDDAEYVRPNQLNGVKTDLRTGVDSNFGVQAEIAVIVNPKNPATRMFSEQAAQFFVGKSSLFTPIDHADGVAVKNEF